MKTDYLKLCPSCKYNFEIMTSNDELYLDSEELGICDCCGKQDKLTYLNVNKNDYLERLKEHIFFKVRICGSRTFNDYNMLKEHCDYYLKDKKPNIIIYSAGGKGADILAKRYAKEYGFIYKEIRPNWSDGLSAGPKTNEKIIKEVDAAIAFWDGESKGTKHTINFCKQYKKPCKVVMI